MEESFKKGIALEIFQGIHGRIPEGILGEIPTVSGGDISGIRQGIPISANLSKNFLWDQWNPWSNFCRNHWLKYMSKLLEKSLLKFSKKNLPLKFWKFLARSLIVYRRYSRLARELTRNMKPSNWQESTNNLTRNAPNASKLQIIPFYWKSQHF